VGAIRAGEKVELRGFGSFRTRKRQARAGRNPRTGAQVHVPPKVVPYFKPGKQLREVLGGE
jgi:integration host factor subunit beta